MRSVIDDWSPRNDITTPLTGTPTFYNSGIIKALSTSNEKISVGQIDYEEYDEENFQYVITPYWDIIDGLTSDVFQGIPGIDMNLRLRHYYRVNYVPVFITERSPSENREDLWELLEEVGLDYYDRFEWLLRTKMRAANDNLIVERRRNESICIKYGEEELDNLQYGDKMIVDSIEDFGNTNTGFSKEFYDVLIRGVDVVDNDGNILVEALQRASLIRLLRYQQLLYKKNRSNKQQIGIEKARENGAYKGRKPINVDVHVLEQTVYEFRQGIISLDEAMKRTKIGSKSTFYRKIKQLEKR